MLVIWLQSQNSRIIGVSVSLTSFLPLLTFARKFRGEARRNILKATEAGVGVVDVNLVSLSGFLHAQAGGMPL